MADASEECKSCEEDEAPAATDVRIEEDVHSSLLAIAQVVPNVWPTGLDSEREEFSSICVAGEDFALSTLTRRPTITLRLHDQATWRVVRPYQMEMRVRKQGRRIFPTLSVSVEGLEADGMYIFFLDLMPKDQNIYAYQSGHWIRLPTTKPYPPPNQASLIHVSNIAFRLGSDLMTYGVNFSSAKITADPATPINRNQIYVHSRQIYLPRYHIVRQLTAEEAVVHQQRGQCANESLSYLEHVGTYVIPETEFIVVNNYRNRHIAGLKMETNPYAGAINARRDSSYYPY
ncbi:T-box transcription factor T [Taenia crassiceps]|uniref:T-box transcription factor T n=1 Tax=Taenia crassiceps TaxID=6207 RepID=A0ABR4Q1L5_9CEST